MEYGINNLEALYNNPNLQQVESLIAEKLNLRIITENLDKLTVLKQKEIDQSGIELNHITQFITNEPNKIVEFATKFLKTENASMLGAGVSITYSIYLIYLIEKNESDLHSFIVKRRIPQPNKVVKQLLNIKKDMGL